jgi:hypothetical protein
MLATPTACDELGRKFNVEAQERFGLSANGRKPRLPAIRATVDISQCVLMDSTLFSGELKATTT